MQSTSALVPLEALYWNESSLKYAFCRKTFRKTTAGSSFTVKSSVSHGILVCWLSSAAMVLNYR